MARKTLDEIEAEIYEIDELVGQLLARSRLDLTALSDAPVALGELARRAGERAGVPALANLVDNAKKHGGGLDHLRVERLGEEVVVTALDRGPGLRPGEEQRVLEPFYGKQENGMLGLGLALVDRIARAHGGLAIAENREGGGARMGLVLPLVVARGYRDHPLGRRPSDALRDPDGYEGTKRRTDHERHASARTSPAYGAWSVLDGTRLAIAARVLHLW